MEHAILQNGTVNIHQHYFDDMIPTPLAQTYSFRWVKIEIKSNFNFKKKEKNHRFNKQDVYYFPIL